MNIVNKDINKVCQKQYTTSKEWKNQMKELKNYLINNSDLERYRLDRVKPYVFI
tara:strand:- start:89 stop:250 length:162 start_codon:yes stop_codon:yes gene_type:complete